MTTLVITPTVVPTSFSLFQGNGVGTATELATTALPTQLVFDSSAIGNPIGAVTTGNAATASVSPVLVGTAFKSTPPSSSTPSSLPTTEAQGSQYRSKALPIAAIILALVAAAAIGAFLLYLWYRKRARRRGHGHSRSHSGSEEYGTAPASDVFRKLGNYEKPADPFSDAHASQSSDPFADPPQHTRTGSDSFLSMNGPRAPYTHAPSASTGSSASSKARKREMEEARQRDMSALNNLVRALDQKDRQAQAEGRDRKSLPPVELFKAALVR